MDIGKLKYTPFYCEENVWHLSQSAFLKDRPRFVVFISNPDRTCALWSQQSSPDPLSPVVWDYHVILVAASEHDEFEVFDLDTNAGFPLGVSTYIDATFPYGNQIPEPFRPRFRIIDHVEHLRTFASDRSHMVAPQGTTVEWLHTPPPWPLVQASGQTMNLDAFIDMESSFVGEVVPLSEFRRRFGG